MSGTSSATVTQADLTAAAEWWRDTAPKAQADWLDVGPPNELQARRALDQMIARQTRETDRLTEQLRRRKITAGEFETAMALIVKRGHIAAAALARGGVGRLTPDDLARIEGAADGA